MKGVKGKKEKINDFFSPPLKKLMISIQPILFMLQKSQGTWLAQSIEHTTLDLGVINLSPMLGVELT